MKHLTSVLSVLLLTSALSLVGCSPAGDKGSSKAPAAERVIATSGGLNVSAQDKRQYAYKTLPNGLKVVVVSDPDADKAAASLDVHIGHMADPADREGITHFLEHMLFLGTGKYPEVGEYAKFVSENGGFHNAGTGQEHTNYFFQIDNAQLEPALDRFSRFFIDPLFDPEFLQKERNAVESEYSLKVKEDARRYREALKQTGNQDHPATQFSVGNLTTLSDTDSSTILDDVKAQYDKYYSSDIMTLSVLGNYPVETLMAWAEEKFSEVPSKGDNRNMDRPEPFLPEQEGVKIMINTLEDKRSLALHFEMPTRTEYYASKPVRYIQSLLGHEGEGTLYDVLNAKGYLKGLSAYGTGPDDYTQFVTYFELTNKGAENIDEIVSYFFSYVEKIKREGVDKKIFNEMADLANVNFEFQDKFRISSFAQSITRNLQYYPPKHALDVGRVFEDFDPELINSFLGEIQPEKMRMIIATPDFDGDTREERYDVAYSVTPLSADKIETWKENAFMNEVNIPVPNPYIAQDISLKDAKVITKPEIAVEQPGLQIWYVNENEFALPKSSFNARLYTKNAYDSAAYQVSINLHSRIISDLLNAQSYPASQAGLFKSLYSIGRGYQMTVQGYNDKLETYLQTILTQMSPEVITEDVFLRMKKNLEQDIANRAFARPINQNFSRFSIEIDPYGLSNEETLAALEGLDLETFKTLIADIQSDIKIEGIYNGNITQQDAVDIGNIFEETFKGRLSDNAKLPLDFIIIPESDTDWIRQFNVDHADSTLLWSFQGDDTSIENRAKSRLITQILKARFYKSLRTDQQLGYQVSMYANENDKRPYTGFYIQSPKAHPSVLKAKFQEFINDQTAYLADISDEDFTSNVEGLLSDINKTFDNIYAKGGTLNSDLSAGNLDFDTRADLTAAIKSLTKEDMLSYYESEFLSDKRRSLAIWSIGKAHQVEPSYDSSAYTLCETTHCLTTKFE